QSGFAFRAARLTLKPKTKQILSGDFEFYELTAESPHLLATLDTPLGAGKPPTETAIPQYDFTIDSLTAVNASWEFKDLRRPKSPQSYSGRGFAIEASGATSRGVDM
ncbi:MAG: hypothetical protein GWO11_00455, partial [Desulfuromonadales bacterium]|nr:hypothetical protein [Desulfuromonadales bacterium]NIR32997.1 hypothetical protein [Desulfuromonadales bacterium]NIS40546.1 hypothetical protein [Desulfuromonadales bacterium]